MNKELSSKWISKPSNKVYIISLVILPITFIYLGLLLKSEILYCHLNSVDPEYIYLFNGLNVANFNFPSHVDHPGTPMQMFIALDLRLVHLFRPGSSLNVDVFKNPEYYISSIRISLVLFYSIALFLLGLLIYTKTDNIILSIFFQLTPFVSYSLLTLLNRIIIEQFFIFTEICLILLIVLFIIEENNKQHTLIDKYVLLFSIVIGFSIATKITFAPLFIIPFILLHGYKKKLLYTLFSILSFGIFAFPIFNRWVYFRNWVINLFIHSGPYGSGKSTIIDINSYKNNIKEIYSIDTFFPIVFFILIIACILYWLPFLKVKVKNDKYYKGLVGIALSMVLMVVLVAKQFNYTYLTPAILLIIPGIYLFASIFSRPLKLITKNIFIIPILLVFIYSLYHFEVKKVFYYHSAYFQRNKLLVKEMNKVVTKFKNKPIALLTYNIGEPFKEYGFYCGMVYCGLKMRFDYASTLKEMYPDFYFYNSWSNAFFTWDNTYLFLDLLKKYKEIVLLIGKPDDEIEFWTKLHGINRQVDTKFRKAYYSEITNETFYYVSYDSIAALKIVDYVCNAEMRDSKGGYYINNYGQKFGNGITQSNERARSGKFSSKLTKGNTFGMRCSLSEVKSGEHYLICAWKYNNHNSDAGLVVSSHNTKIFYTLQTKPEEEQGMWQKLQIDLVVPESLNNQDIEIYCRNNNNDLPVYFDDLEIKKLIQ